MEKTVLLGKSLNEIEEIVAGLGEAKFRAKQILDWLNKGIACFSEMKNIPLSFRKKLAEIAQPLPCTIKRTLTSADNNTHKLLLEFPNTTPPLPRHPVEERGPLYNSTVIPGEDPGPHPLVSQSQLIETVLMRTRYGNSVCISSQSGCAMGCKFCASTLRGFERNLTATEMLAQVSAAQSLLMNERISHVVIMGSGEPLLNLNNTIEFMTNLNSPPGEGSAKPGVGINKNALSWRRITLSTCGIPSGIDRLTEWGKPINLALSLHAPTNGLRTKIMPINAKHPLEEVLAATDRWQAATKRQLTAEYIVLKDTNDTPAHAQELVDLIGNRDIFVNLIPFNPVAERDFSAPSNNAVHRIKDILDKNKIPCAIRFERGADINSACGQLRSQSI